MKQNTFKIACTLTIILVLMVGGHVSLDSAQFIPLRTHILLMLFIAVALLNQVILNNISYDLAVLECISLAVLGTSRFHVVVNNAPSHCFFVHVHRKKCFLLWPNGFFVYNVYKDLLCH